MPTDFAHASHLYQVTQVKGLVYFLNNLLSIKKAELTRKRRLWCGRFGFPEHFRGSCDESGSERGGSAGWEFECCLGFLLHLPQWVHIGNFQV